MEYRSFSVLRLLLLNPVIVSVYLKVQHEGNLGIIIISARGIKRNINAFLAILYSIYLSIDISLFIEVWCNGSTTDFGSVSPSSNLGTSTIRVTIVILIKTHSVKVFESSQLWNSLDFILSIWLFCYVFSFIVNLNSKDEQLIINKQKLHYTA